MYTLILTISYIGNGGAVYIEHIPGFKTMEACEQAGRTWKEHYRSGALYFQYDCVSMG